MAIGEISARQLGAWVSNMWNGERGWKWEHIKNLLPPQVVDMLELCSLIDRPGEDDNFGWRLTASSKFSVSSAYYEITKRNSGLQDNHWTKIWEIKAPMKILAFL